MKIAALIILGLNVFLVYPQDRRINIDLSQSAAVSLEQLNGTIYKLTEKQIGTYRLKDLGDQFYTNTSGIVSTVDTTTFNQNMLDTSLFSGKYFFWQDVLVMSDYPAAPIAADMNKNERAELYGLVWTFQNETSESKAMHTFELNTSGKFTLIHQFPQPKRVDFARNIVDIDGDGIDEIHLRLTDSVFIDSTNSAFSQKEGIYKKTSATSLATQYYFKYSSDGGGDQRNDPTWGDFDKDGKKDMVYLSYAYVYKMIILEYNSETHYMDSVYLFDPKTYTAGYSVGDFDNDGKTDIVMGSVGGKVFIVECQGDNLYQNVWTGQVSTKNAYLHFWTNDIDGNGKKEFWVGGDGFFNDKAKTRLTAFESDSNNSYRSVAIIDIDGIFSLSAGNCFGKDVDGDLKDEIFLCVDQSVFIFKFNGSPEHHTYSLLYYKFNELAKQYGQYAGATLFDLDYDGKDELLISQFQDDGDPFNGRIQYFTRLYKLETPLSIFKSPNLHPLNYEMWQNYPNPFNPKTSIKYSLSQNEQVSIKVFSILGNEIKTIVNEYLQSGVYTSVWDGRDANGFEAASGIYLIQFKTIHYQKTIKAILIR